MPANKDSGLSGFCYEINFCAYLFCECKERSEAQINDPKRIENFYISNNRINAEEPDEVQKPLKKKSAGADDIVLKYDYMKDAIQQQCILLMQLKHTVNKVSLKSLIDSGTNSHSTLEDYHNDFRKEKLRSGSSTAVEIIHISTSPLIGPKKDEAFIEKLDDECSFLNIDNGKNKHYKINIEFMVKRKKKLETIMDALNKEDCELFVENFVNVLRDHAQFQKEYVNIFVACKKQILKEIINVTKNGIATFKKELLDKEENKKSPFEKCLLRRVPDCRDVAYQLPPTYCQEETHFGEKILLYTRQYFEEFFNAFKIYVKQPNEEHVTKIIEKNMARRYMISSETAKLKANSIISEVRSWWGQKGRVEYLQKSSEIIKEAGKSQLKFQVPHALFNDRCRKLELEEFHNLRVTSSISNIRVVHGLGGVGKTEFVKHYIEVHGHCYQNKIFWFHAEDRSAFTKSLKDLIDTTLTFMKKHQDDDKTVDPTQEIFNYFFDKTCLIVFDNVDDDKYIYEVLELIKKHEIWKPHIIMTTRISTWDKSLILYPLGVFQRKDAFRFIIDGIGDMKDIYNQDLDETIMNSEKYRSISKLAETLQNLPLALQHAISYIYNEKEIKCSDEYTIDDYIKEYEEKDLVDDIGFKELRDKYAKTTYKTVMISINKIQSVVTYGDVALRLLRLIAFCAPINIDIAMFTKLSDLREDIIHQGVGLLTKYSIMNEDSGQMDLVVLNIHRLVQSVVRLNIERIYIEEGRKKEAILQEALNMLEQNNTRKILDHLLTVWKYARSFDTLLKEFGGSFKNILDVMFKESRFQEAENFSKETLESLQRHVPDDKKSAIDVKVERIKLLQRLSKFKEAMDLCDEVLEVSNNQDKEIFYEVKDLKGRLLSQMCQYDEALKVYESITTADIDLGTDHPIALKIKEGIARVYKRKDECGKALDIINSVLEKLEMNKAEGKDVDEPFLWRLKSDAASCYKYLGELDTAETIFKEVLSERQNCFGERSALTIKSMNNLSVLYVQQGKYEEALEIDSKILEIKKDIYGEKSASTLLTQHNIASIYLYLDPERYEEGCKLCKEVAFARKDLLGFRHKSTLNSFHQYAKMLCNLKKYKEALEINKECYEVILDIYKNENHSRVLGFRSNMAKIYSALGQTEKALNMAREILNLRMEHKEFGENHPDTLISMHTLADILADKGDTKEALEMLYKFNETAPKYFTLNHFIRRKANERIQQLEGLISRNESQEFIDELPFSKINTPEIINS